MRSCECIAMVDLEPLDERKERYKRVDCVVWERNEGRSCK